jgi:hypothetical protein
LPRHEDLKKRAMEADQQLAGEPEDEPTEEAA